MDWQWFFWYDNKCTNTKENTGIQNIKLVLKGLYPMTKLQSQGGSVETTHRWCWTTYMEQSGITLPWDFVLCETIKFPHNLRQLSSYILLFAKIIVIIIVHVTDLNEAFYPPKSLCSCTP